MKSSLVTTLFVLALAGAPLLSAEDVFMHPRQIKHVFESSCPYLSLDEQDRFEKALYPALQNDPSLIEQGRDLWREGGSQVSADNAVSADYRAKRAAYESRLRHSMESQDAGVGPIFDKIDAHLHTP